MIYQIDFSKVENLNINLKLLLMMESPKNSTWTVTFGECVENHVGMEQVGNMAKEGFTIADLNKFALVSQANGYVIELIDLEQNLPSELRSSGTAAKVLIIRNGIRMLTSDDADDYSGFLREIKASEHQVDRKAWMRGRVVNKRARYNLCYGDVGQEPDYENKKGRIVPFDDVPYLQKVRENLDMYFGSKCHNLLAELNFYEDINKNYIGFHGDGERRLVVGLRVGITMNLKYQWFHWSKAIGKQEIMMLNEGDIYMMSEKAAGTDWKKGKFPTLRHAAGADKHTTIKKK